MPTPQQRRRRPRRQRPRRQQPRASGAQHGQMPAVWAPVISSQQHVIMLRERREPEQERSEMLLRRSAESAARSWARGIPLEPPPGYEWSGQPGGSVLPIGARKMLNAPYKDLLQRMRSEEEERDAALQAVIRRLRAGSSREQQERADLLQCVVDGELICVPLDCLPED